MDDFGPQIVPAVLAACQASAADASQTFSQAFDVPLQIAVGESSTVGVDALSAEFVGPGLVVRFSLGPQALLLLVSESTGLLPEWYNHPTPTHAAKLATLAQELGMLLLPESLAVQETSAAAVADLPSVLGRCNCAAETAIVRFTLGKLEGTPGNLALIWPIGDPAAVFDPPAEKAAEPAATSPVEPASMASEPVAGRPAEAARRPVEDASPPAHNVLPKYSRSLLRIQVPVMVTLATKKQLVSKIIEIVPGTILQFDKSCDETLELEVGAQRIAQGECVKVGEKFGLRITSLILPAERFNPITPAAV